MPLQRLGDTGELVGAALFLASRASSYVTGQILRVDGGISAGINWPIELD
jgi:NAD(P)-dependent dehydrogenase (short-subunit alcohol dehydrogenase family)